MDGYEPNPDLGGGDSGSTGGNIIRNNSVCGLTNLSGGDISARFNTWNNQPPVDGTDICTEGTGGIITE